MRPLIVPRFGRASIVTDAAGAYQPHPDGAAAAVLGVDDRCGELIDAVAWLPEQPARWWLRQNAATVLGEAELERAAFLDRPILILPTPAAWLDNHGAGGRWPACTVLDWSADPRLIFTGVRVICDSDMLARRLEQAQRRHDRPLRITVDRVARRAA